MKTLQFCLIVLSLALGACSEQDNSLSVSVIEDVEESQGNNVDAEEIQDSNPAIVSVCLDMPDSYNHFASQLPAITYNANKAYKLYISFYCLPKGSEITLEVVSKTSSIMPVVSQRYTVPDNQTYYNIELEVRGVPETFRDEIILTATTPSGQTLEWSKQVLYI